jgi:gamma-glutamyltranspeptidase/glutathione hydrolase
LVARAWGHDVWTVPPASQGYLTLLSCAIADGLDLPEPADGSWAHLLVETARAAGHDRPEVLFEGADVRSLLAPDAVRRRRALVDPDRRNAGLPTGTADGGTMHLCAGDAEGTAVSLIQSNASGFGALVFEPTTGIGLHNRGIGFNLRLDHPACYGPGRRPPHTLSPALVTRPDGSLRAAVGTMGGDSQPQILLQVLSRWLHHDADPGGAIDAPRWVLAARTGFDTWRAPDGAHVRLEHDAPPGWAPALRARGHEVEEAPAAMSHAFGHAHLLERTDSGWAGATDPRAGGSVAASSC